MVLSMQTSGNLVQIAERLRDAVEGMSFAPPVTHVYNPLVYAWELHKQYLERYGFGTKKVVFLGMNPGPFGMGQVGVPFGEITAVYEWLRIRGEVGRPTHPHPKRPVHGFACPRSEVSGRRMWGLFAERFEDADHFFRDHFVMNYCPLMFMEESGRNRTPDKLLANEREALFAACDQHLRDAVAVLDTQWVIGVGAFAESCATRVLEGIDVKIGRILHPSPASPAANRGWSEAATRQLTALGVWE
jgi:single-strand selective monofunctional uracil DNA glycosylase